MVLIMRLLKYRIIHPTVNNLETTFTSQWQRCNGTLQINKYCTSAYNNIQYVDTANTSTSTVPRMSTLVTRIEVRIMRLQRDIR